MLACLLAACASRGGSPAPRPAAHARRCTLRISPRGIFVDGDPMSRVDAVAYCKRTEGALVRIEDGAPATEWDQTRAALQREGVAIVMPGRPAEDIPGRRYPVVPTPMRAPPPLVSTDPK